MGLTNGWVHTRPLCKSWTIWLVFCSNGGKAIYRWWRLLTKAILTVGSMNKTHWSSVSLLFIYRNCAELWPINWIVSPGSVYSGSMVALDMKPQWTWFLSVDVCVYIYTYIYIKGNSTGAYISLPLQCCHSVSEWLQTAEDSSNRPKWVLISCWQTGVVRVGVFVFQDDRRLFFFLLFFLRD